MIRTITIPMPRDFKVGDTVPCEINKKPAKVTWRDRQTLVIDPGNAKLRVGVRSIGNLRWFVCTQAAAVAAGIYAGDSHD